MSVTTVETFAPDATGTVLNLTAQIHSDASDGTATVPNTVVQEVHPIASGTADAAVNIGAVKGQKRCARCG